MIPKYNRSYLCAPAHQRVLVEKAYASEADAIMLDLEDGVPEHAKDEARAAAVEILTSAPPKPTYLRVNTMASGRCRDDILALANGHMEAIRLPKCESAEDLARAGGWLRQVSTRAGIQVIIETAMGLRRMDEIASAWSDVDRISLGESDLIADLGVEFHSTTMDVSRAECVVVARSVGLPPPPQSVYPDLRDPEGLRASCRKGKAMGFFGRFAIHPAQLAIINDVFTPTREEVSDAQAIVDAARAAETSDKSVFLLPDSQLVGPPSLMRANAVLALAGATSQASKS